MAQVPELVQTRTEATVWITGKSSVALIGRCSLEPVPETNYAEGFVRVRGLKLKARAKVNVKVDGYSTTASVKVVERERTGPPIRIELFPEDYVTTRAKWANDEGQPNLLKIGAKHRAIAPHMGKESDTPRPFSGQDTPVGRILIAEVVAESVCRRELVLDAFNNPGKFRWTSTSEHPAAVADGVLVELQRRMSGFLAEAHPIALRDLPRLDQG